MAKAGESIETLKKRWKAAEEVKETWEAKYRVRENYNYWRGDQLVFPFDEWGNRRVQINKIFPDVRNNIPSLYFYRPYARLTAEPEHTDTPGSQLETRTTLLQDTGNHLVRNPDTLFRQSTFLALTEAHWGCGVVEVGYAPDFGDAPQAKKPPLKEDKKTKLPPVPKDEEEDEILAQESPLTDEDGLTLDMNAAELKEELSRLKDSLRDEKFYVKHIPSKQVFMSNSDKPILEENDWVGYWEEMALEDVKRVPAYKNTKNLKASYDNKEDEERQRTWNEETGTEDRIKLYKMWDLRTKTRYVMAQGHKKYLLVKKFKRCPLKFLRFAIDPYHFWPIPPIVHKLPVQDEYNSGRDYIRKVRQGTVPRYTYDEDALEANQMRKLERGDIGSYIPRKGGTGNVIEAVQQPTYSETAIQTLTLSDKEFRDVGGVGGDAKVAPTKTATQAKIAEVKEQSQDSFDRGIVGDWLGSIIKELIILSIENMNIDRFIQTNVAPDSPMYPQIAQDVAQQFQMINADILSDKAQGIRWDVSVDVDSLSPVSEEEKLQKWMQGLSFITNPMSAQLFAAAPPILERTLDLMGMKSAKDKELITQGLQAFSQMMQQQQQQAGSSPQGPGVSPQQGAQNPGTPGPPPGGPQPGGPPGPGSSQPQ